MDAPRSEHEGPGGVERILESVVASRSEHEGPGGVERILESVVAPRLEHEGPGGVERTRHVRSRLDQSMRGQEVWRGPDMYCHA